jgi:hypothetical protein
MNRFTKAQNGVARWMHALVLVWSNGYYVRLGANTLILNAKWEIRVFIYSSWGSREQDHSSMNTGILGNPHARQKWNGKKALDQVKKKMEL